MGKKSVISAEAFAQVCEPLWAPLCTPLAVPEQVLEPLRTYVSLLMKWNASMNLVGSRSWQSCVQNLLVDSFHVAQFLEALPLPEAPHSWDLGAGAGLPGVPLRMVWDAGHYTLVEAREKRALFLQTVLAHIPLTRTHVFTGRAEHFFSKAAAPAHVIISRAFMPWAELLRFLEAPFTQGHIHTDARVVFLALESAPEGALRDMGWAVERTQTYCVHKGAGQEDARWLWSVQRAE